MVCYTTCAFAVALIVASFYIMFTKNDIQKSQVILRTELGDIYDKIANERLKIYIIASIVGAILGIIYLIWMKKKVSTLPLICTAILIFFLTQFIIYLLYPKSDYILNHIIDGEEAKAWLDMYRKMMSKFWIGFIVGLIGYAVLCFALLR